MPGDLNLMVSAGAGLHNRLGKLEGQRGQTKYRLRDDISAAGFSHLPPDHGLAEAARPPNPLLTVLQ